MPAPHRHAPENASGKIITALELLLAAGAGAVLVFWVAGRPLLYSKTEPVMSLFTALSLLLLTGVRLARRHLFAWPTALSLALLGLVLGGNLSSILLQTSGPANLMRSFPSVVLTSNLTAGGLILFCLYELLIALRETPRSALLLDDILLHLALVPGGLNLLGHLLGNPAYLSVAEDPRVGISLLETGFMAMYAVGAVLSNPGLFLWRFLARGWGNRFIFALFFLNQFVAPLLVALAFARDAAAGPGIELFVMLAGVMATLTFLLVQAYLYGRAGVR